MDSIEELLDSPESQYYDRKSAGIPLSKLAEAIVGFANADGGKIAIGIKNKQLEGIENQGELRINNFIRCAFEQCTPSVKVSYSFIDFEKANGANDRILILDIPPAVNQVHATTADKVFLRVGDSTLELKHEQRLNLEYDKGSRIYEDNIVEDCTLEDLDMDLIKQYKEIVKFREDDYGKLLRARGFAKNTDKGMRITIAGVLVFGKYPTQFVPSAKVRFFRYEGISAETGIRMNIIKRETFEAPLPILINELKEVIHHQLREFTALSPSTGKFQEVPEYPEFAWLEGIVNAVTHRAYNIHGDDIRVTMFDDRLEIYSPGKLPSIVTINNIKDVRYSRNPKVARALTEFGWARELGEGVKRIFDEMEIFFLDDPVFEEKEQSLKLTLKNNIVMRRVRRLERINTNISGHWKSLSKNQQIALEIADKRGNVKVTELAKHVNIAKPTAKKILTSLEEKGFLKWVGNSPRDPYQYYEIPPNEE